MKKTFLVSSIFFVLIQTGFSQSKKYADFLIVKNLSSLVIYNQFQQRMTTEQLSKYSAGIPFQILDNHDFLSDNYTPCLKVMLNEKIFFIEKTQQGKIVNAEKSEISSVYKSSLIFSDTIEVLNSQNKEIKKDEKLIRIFKSGDKTYCKTISGNYSWVTLESEKENVDWKKFKRAVSVSTSISPEIIRQIKTRLAAINQKLKLLFDHFNEKEQTQVEIPQWIISEENESVFCELKNGNIETQFSESARYILSELETATLGTGLKISKKENGFLIKTK